MEFLGIRKESKSARIRQWSGILSAMCFNNLIADVGAKMLLSICVDFPV